MRDRRQSHQEEVKEQQTLAIEHLTAIKKRGHNQQYCGSIHITVKLHVISTQ